MSSTEIIKCLRCPFKGPESSFPRKQNMRFSKTCLTCLEITNAKTAKKRALQAKKPLHTDKENMESGSDECRKGKSITKHPPTLTWDKFLSILTENKDHPFELHTFVKINQDSPTAVKTTHDQAVDVANAVKQATGFQFKYVQYLQEITKRVRN